MLAELVLDPHHLITRAVGRHNKGTDTALAGVWIGDGENDHRAGMLARRDELLGSIEHVVIAVAPGAGAQAAGIGAGLRFGEGKGADLLAARQRAKEIALLLVVAETQDGHATHRVVHAHDGRAGAVTGGDLLQRHGIGQVARVAAAPLLRHQHAEETERGHLADRLGRVTVLAAPLFGEGLQALPGELPGHLGDRALILIGQHGRLLRPVRRPWRWLRRRRCRSPPRRGAGHGRAKPKAASPGFAHPKHRWDARAHRRHR